MIVDPDFLDHWRTQMLSDLLDGDQMAPVYVIRLWSHCQNRRDTRFSPMPTAGLKAICRFQGDAAQLETAMIQAGFVERDGDEISVPKWAEYNSQLMANWENGRRGGRPKKTHPKPNGNPSETQPKPKSAESGNGVTSLEPRREEKRREDIEEKKTPPAAEARPDQDRSLDESRAAPWQPDIEVMLLAAWEAADGRIRYPHAELTPGRRRMLLERSASPSWNWRAALEKFPLKCTQGRRDGWRPSLGWFLKEDSVDSILEGAYDWSPNSAGAEDRLAALDRYAAMDDEPEPIDVPNFAEQFR